MLRRVGLILTTAILLLAVSANIALASGVPISESPDYPGCVLVEHPGAQYGKVKAIVQKGDQRYTYDIRLTENPECLPLQMGEGEYTVRLMRQVSGTRYREVARKQITLESVDEHELFLASVQSVAWDGSAELKELAQELTKSCETDSEKVQSIHEYLVQNFVYDHQKARTVEAGYLPDLSQILADKKGICYDFASLFAGLLRSVGVPTKLLTGYVGVGRAYHAWNEVYQDGTWERYDLTKDIANGKRVTESTATYEIRYVF